MKFRIVHKRNILELQIKKWGFWWFFDDKMITVDYSEKVQELKYIAKNYANPIEFEV
jgi:uncharacterized protein YneR